MHTYNIHSLHFASEIWGTALLCSPCAYASLKYVIPLGLHLLLYYPQPTSGFFRLCYFTVGLCGTLPLTISKTVGCWLMASNRRALDKSGRAIVSTLNNESYPESNKPHIVLVCTQYTFQTSYANWKGNAPDN